MVWAMQSEQPNGGRIGRLTRLGWVAQVIIQRFTRTSAGRDGTTTEVPEISLSPNKPGPRMPSIEADGCNRLLELGSKVTTK
jgi:hypothetical protein